MASEGVFIARWQDGACLVLGCAAFGLPIGLEGELQRHLDLAGAAYGFVDDADAA